MRCSVCNAEVSIFDSNCASCGASIDTATTRASSGYRPQQNQPAQPVQGKGAATSSFVLGLITLNVVFLFFPLYAILLAVSSTDSAAPLSAFVILILGLLMSIIGLSLAKRAKRRLPYGVSRRGLATAGTVFNIIALVISSIIIVFSGIILYREFVLVTPQEYIRDYDYDYYSSATQQNEIVLSDKNVMIYFPERI